jgi:unsaturated rhamnogalacturonyl hydrolase
MSLLPEFIYTTGKDGLYINQFVASAAVATLSSGKKVSVKTETGYPAATGIAITITPEKKEEFTVYIRIPSWCKTPAASVNGKALEGVVAGRYLRIKRRWKGGEKIEIQLPMKPEWIRRQHHINASDRKPYKTSEDLNAPYALVRGPVVYAVDNTWYEGPLSDFPDKTLSDIRLVLGDPATFATVKTPRPDMLGPGYRVPVQLSDGRRTSLPVYPFANIGVWYKDANAKPDRDSDTYSYAVWLKGIAADNKQPDKRWSVRMAKSEMARYPHAWQYEGRTPRWGYHQGVIFKAMLDLWQYTEDPRYYDYAHLYADSVIAANGSIRTYSMEAFNIDNINAGKILFPLYNQTRETKYSLAIQTLRNQMRKQPRTSEGGFWHKKRYPNQMWLDGLYMAAPFLAQYARDFGENALYDDVVNQLTLIAKHTYDARTGLYYHAWDESREQRWANKETGQSPNFWGRSIGWYAMALVDVLDYLPDDHPGRKDIQKIIQQLAAGIVEYQEDRSGVWYQVMDQGGRPGNYLEASASGMFVYFLYKGVRRGYLAERYRAAADKGYAGLLKNFIREEADGRISLTGTCAVAGLGGEPYRDGSYEYYVGEPVRDNDPKGVGPFIWASIEHELTQTDPQTPTAAH